MIDCLLLWMSIITESGASGVRGDFFLLTEASPQPRPSKVEVMFDFIRDYLATSSLDPHGLNAFQVSKCNAMKNLYRA
jgi:hypothetical protein